MERALYFSKFRNIGFKSDEKLILNTTMEKGKMGNLVIVVGANNSGKSNVLDGLCEFGEGNLFDKDRTTLSFDENDSNPVIRMNCKNNSKSYTYSVGINKKSYDFPDMNSKTIFEFSKDFDKTKEYIEYFKERLAAHGYDNYINEYYNPVIAALEDGKLSAVEKEAAIIKFIKDVKNRNFYGIDYGINDLNKKYPNTKFGDFLKNGIPEYYDIKKRINDDFKENYGVDFVPTIVRYNNKTISNNDITCAIESISSNLFFTSLFEKVGITLNEISRANEIAKKNHTFGPLKTLENQLNQKLEPIANDFNDLYFADNDKYSFELRLESTQITFILLRGTKDISLDAQSTGFKWFFDLYFNLLCNNKLSAGDIIIMDEPATNLHVNGQKELRKFLKEFAIKNDLVIIIATHSPFLIDLDYLDELRVISMNDNVSTIKNDFHTIDEEDPDSLKTIKQALTVSNHILVDPDIKVVFVEGITDYNYLTAFKQVLGKKDIVFLPINGVGNIREKNNKVKQTNISKELISLRKHGATLLVDGDGAGKAMQKLNVEEGSDLEVISLKDIDETFKEIENVFDPEDLHKLGLVENNGQYVKRSINSGLIKTYVADLKFSTKTKENFSKIFDKLLEF